MKKKMLITGGCGFIGTNIALYFVDKGYVVFIVDNLSRPGSEINARLLEERGIIHTHLDISSQGEELLKMVRENDIDVIIHAAAQVAVTTSVTDPMFDFRINALGSLNVLEAARHAPKKPFVLFTSTNKVYGELKQIPTEEKDTRYAFTNLPLGIHEETLLDFHSPYGCSKGAADQYTRDWARIYSVPTVVFRQSCIYGPHQFGIVDQGWVAFLTMQAFFERPITIFGDGKQVRDILAVSDLVYAMEQAIENKEKTQGQIFNIGGSSKYSISLLEFTAFLEKRLNKKLDIRMNDWRPGDQKIYISDVGKAKEYFNWSPNTSLSEGFEDMFSWIEKNRDVLQKFV